MDESDERETIDGQKLAEALSRELEFAIEASQLGQPAGTRASDDVQSLLQEMVEDNMDLLQRMTALEQAQNQILARLDQLDRSVLQGARAAVQEVNGLRSDLLGDAKERNALSVFTAVVKVVDSMDVMLAAIEPDVEAQAYGQIRAARQHLVMMLRTLGFFEYSVESGVPFDPACMECVRYGAGEMGVALACTRVGYRTKTGVVRPAGVILAYPHQDGA